MRKRRSSVAPTVESAEGESPAVNEEGDEEGEEQGEEQGPGDAEVSRDELPPVAADDATGSYASDVVADAPLEGGDGDDDTLAVDDAATPGGEGVVDTAAEPASAAAETGAETETEGESAGADATEGDGAPMEVAGDETELPASAELPPGLAPGADDEAVLPTDETRLQSIVESLLFASDRALAVADLKRLLNERDSKRITTALEALRERRGDTGIQLVSVAGGWQLRTHPANGAWVAKLVAGRPQRLSRAMMETLAIVAYRQPITRPEIDEIRGVDCGPVLRTLLDRSLVRVIGKKEEVGRPMLYGTTPEFLKTFSLRDLTELPTLRDFHELGAAERAEVDAVTAARGQAGVAGDLDAPLDIGA